MSRKTLPVLAILALLGSFAFVSGQDLAEIKARQQIAAQKLTEQVKAAIAQSRKLEQTKPTEARELLQTRLREVDASLDLTGPERDGLRRQLNVRLNEVGNAIQKAKVEQEQKNLRDPDRPFSRFGPNAPASGMQSDLAKARIDAARGAQGTTQGSIRDRERNTGKIFESAAVSSIPSDADFTLPKYWKELSASRKKLMGPQLTEQETKVLKALNSTISVKYQGEKFKGVLEELQDRTGLTLIMDEGSVQDLNLDYDDPVKLQLNKVTVRTALKKILGDRGLTYIIKEGNLQVMTPKKAAEFTVIRSYPIDGLVAPNQFAMSFGPIVARAQMLANVQTMINMIQNTVEPNYWQPNGPGTITFYEPTMSLSIRASAELHYSLPGLIGR